MGTRLTGGLARSVCCLLLHVVIAQGSDPCQTYISFPDLEKRDINYTASPTEIPLSDSYISIGDHWFGEPGYDLATSQPPSGEDRCGTVYPIWVDDELPEEGEMEVMTCLVYFDVGCVQSWKTQVKVCENLRIYKLTDSPSDSAYCVAQSTYTVQPTVDQELGSENNLFFYKFLCIFERSTENLWYSVHWYVNGYYVTSFPAVEWTDHFTDDTALTEDILINSGYKSPGFDLQCMVKASLGAGLPAGEGILSDRKFIGVKIPMETIIVKEGEDVDIDLQLSTPFGCPEGHSCSLSVLVRAKEAPANCDLSAFVKTKCGVKFKDNSWQDLQKLTVKGKVTSDINAKETTMKLFLSTEPWVISHNFWSNYNIGSLTVLVKKEAGKPKQYCSANCDPHMRTYDNLGYEFQGKDGVYVLYKHNSIDIEVQMKLLPCYGGAHVRCPCGVAVRAGRTVFRINSCYHPVQIGFPSCIDGKDLVRVLKNQTAYKIYLPSGTRVDVRVHPRDKFFNIGINPSIEDYDAVSGLCGNFNYNENDDVDQNTMFQDWLAEVDLFNDNNFSKLKAWESTFGLCVCEAENAFNQPLNTDVSCSRTDPNPCTFDQTYSEPPTYHRPCFIEIGRRKRSALYERVMVESRFKRDADEDGEGQQWTEEEATTYCDTFFNQSKAASLCAEIPGMISIINENKHNCVLDILASQGTTFAMYALESSKDLCLNEVQQNSTLQEETEPGVPSVYETLLDVTCDNDCSYRGNCVHGECVCNDGFAGSDCSQDKDVPLEILGMDLDGHCDVGTEICNETALIADFFDELGQKLCHFVGFTLLNDGSEIEGTAVESEALVESFTEAICPLPTFRRKRSAEPTVPADSVVASGYKISVANYGNVFSKETTLVLYNSECQACDVTGTQVNCVFTSKSCIVGSQCVKHGDTHPENPCFTCDATMPDRRWLRKNEDACTIKSDPEEEDSKMWIIGAVIGGLLLAFIVVAVTCVIMKKGKSGRVTSTPKGSSFLTVQ